MANDHRGYITTDLAIESRVTEKAGRANGAVYSEREEGGFRIAGLEVTDKRGERETGRARGRYVTVTLGKPWLFGEEETAAARDLLAREIASMARGLSPCGNVLIVGLGNRQLTADALGPSVADGILVTRHIKDRDERLFRSLGGTAVSSFSPGVLGQTGIETLELVRGAVERVKPDLVVAVDALAARGVDRLATTVQICDVGLCPGSGIGNTRQAIDRGSLGVPVLAVGAPTVVNSSTLVRDALSLAGTDKISPELESVLENGRSFFVSLKEADVAVSELANLISQAINQAFRSKE